MMGSADGGRIRTLLSVAVWRSQRLSPSSLAVCATYFPSGEIAASAALPVNVSLVIAKGSLVVGRTVHGRHHASPATIAAAMMPKTASIIFELVRREIED